MPRARLVGAVLAGGRSTRMDGQTKALISLGGKPMIRHVIDRLRPQVDELWLSVESESPDLAVFDLPQIADLRPGSQGPLGGLVACLSRLADPDGWLLLAPCDAPFVPRRLASELLACARRKQAPGCLVRYAGEAQPTFSLWHGSLLPRVAEAVEEQGLRGFKAFLRIQPLPALDWPPGRVSPFMNINDRQTLLEAERLLDTG
ncbi:MAG: molybdenum cofactor guanylyltransferase [Xanthomonadales bacterium]|nr:molybdenum cofactor guanylyltransferase [Xanthomonadales bacterium]